MSKPKITVHYGPQCRALGDFEVERYYADLLALCAQHGDMFTGTSSGVFLSRLRLAAVRDEIDLVIVYEGVEHPVNEYGYPEGFDAIPAIEMDFIEAIVRTAAQKRRQK